MFELIRKHQYGIMVVVAAIVIVAFTFLYDPNRDSLQNRTDLFTVYGRSYDEADYSRVLRLRDVLMALGFYSYAMTMDGLDQKFGSQNEPGSPFDYVANTVILRREAERLGIRPTPDQIKSAVQEARIFQTDGQFDPQKWANFENYLSSQGLTLPDVFAAVGDTLAYEELTALVSAGVLPSPREVEALAEERNLKVFASAALVETPSAPESEEITDEEIQTYYEENKATLSTPEKRAVSYVYFESPEARRAREDADAPDEPEDPSAEPEDPSAGPDEPAAGPDEPAEPDENERKKERKVFAETVVKFDQEIVENSPEQFEAIARKDPYASYGAELKTTEPFTQDDPPEALASQPEVVAQIFRRDPGDPIGNPIKTDDGGYYFFKITEVAEPDPLKLESAREEIVSVLSEQKAAARASEAAQSARESLTAALESGSSFAEAAEAAGLKVIDVPMFTAGQPPREVDHAMEISRTAAKLAPGELSEPVPVAPGSLLVHVEAKERPLDETVVESQKAIVEQQMQFMDERSLFLAWFRERKDEAEFNLLPAAVAASGKAGPRS